MKLIIQIPCFNEEETLPITFRDLPKQIPGIEEIEVLIINDGSSDNTVEVAQSLGVDYIINVPTNKGLANAFKVGIDECLKRGADIIVNTDADNQYRGEDISKLVTPILEQRAEIVVGERPIDNIDDFSYLKKKLQKLGSWVVRAVSKTNIPDAPSGFRAYSRDAAMRLNVVSNYTYTLETIIQAGRNNISMMSVPIRTNGKLRESRLFSSMKKYIIRSINTMIRIFAFYKPLRLFVGIGSIFMTAGIALGIRFLVLIYLFNNPNDRTYIPSIILGTSLIIIATLIFIIGILSDIISHNRKLNEDILYKLKKIELRDYEKEKEGACE